MSPREVFHYAFFVDPLGPEWRRVLRARATWLAAAFAPVILFALAAWAVK